LPEKLEKIKQAAQKLPEAAATLNQATDQLGRAITELDNVLKKFSLGVPTWVPFAKWQSEYIGHHWEEEIGYAKVNGKWGIAIRTVKGNYARPEEEDDVETWQFNEAPRLLRVSAIERVPELLEELLKNATKMTEDLTTKASEVDAFTGAIQSIIEEADKSNGPVAQPAGRPISRIPLKAAPPAQPPNLHLHPSITGTTKPPEGK
jgi:hypothetical protein